MAWTAPRTWVAGEVVTAAMMNTHVRDNLSVVTRTLAFGAAGGDVTSTAAETAVFAYTIPANTLAVNGSVRITMLGNLLFNNGADSITYRMKLNGTTVFQDAISSSTAATRRPIYLSALISVNASTTATVGGTFGIGEPAAPTTGMGEVDSVAKTGGTSFGNLTAVTIALGSSMVVTLTAQNGSASANLSTQMYGYSIEYIPPPS